MNAKKAKQLRKTLKADGIDVRHCLYDLRKVVSKNEEDRHVISLSANCGRKLYQRAKALLAA